MKRYIIGVLLVLTLVPIGVSAGSTHVHAAASLTDYSNPNEPRRILPGLLTQVEECGCTIIQIDHSLAMAGAATTGVFHWNSAGSYTALCEGGRGGSGGGGNSGPPSLSSVTVDEYEDIMRRLLGDVTVKIEDLEGQVGQAVLDALNQGNQG